MEDIFKPDRIRNTLERLIHNLPGFVYRCRNDQQWTMLFISDQCERITGYSAGELTGNKFISYDEVIEPSYREYLHERWVDVIRNKEVLKEEYKIIRKDGQERWVWEQGRGVYDEVTGELLYLDGYITDVTERVEAYENLLLANQELTEANKRREEAMTLKSQFLSNLSHEIRTPVNAIMGFTQILSEEGLSNEDKNDCLEIIHKSNRSLLKLIDDIVQASKIETNQLKPHISRMTAGELSRELGKAATQLLQEYDKVNLELTTIEGTANEGLIVFTDKEFVKDIVLRLLDNAARFTEIGSVHLHIFISDDKTQMFFDVSDQGYGIKKEVEANLFKSFYRADDPINTRTRGAGLGLFISKSCAMLLNGELLLLDNSAKGATFRLMVPVTPVLG